jgi:hypothetical protein
MSSLKIRFRVLLLYNFLAKFRTYKKLSLMLDPDIWIAGALMGIQAKVLFHMHIASE